MTDGAWLGRIVALCLSLALLACATPPHPRPVAGPPSQLGPDVAASYSGRLSVRVEAPPEDASAAPAQAYTALFDLNGTPDQGELALMTPLGTTLAQAAWQGDAAQWVDAKGQHHQNTVSALTRQALGTPLPLSALMSWLQGQPSPEQPSLPLPAPAIGFSQLGWTVNLQHHASGQIQLTRATPSPTTVRIRIDPPTAH